MTYLTALKKRIRYGLLIAIFLFVNTVVIAFETDQKALRIPMRNYNITASDTHQFVWFRTAKVGTRTILEILEKNVPLSTNNFKVIYNPNDYKGYFKFAFVRNPWDRVVSCYCNKVLSKCHHAFRECFDKDFDYFVDFIDKQDLSVADAHIRLQTTLMPLHDLDFIGRLETFSEDLSYVLSVIGLEHIKIGHKNSSQHQHYSHYYTPRTIKIIAKKYKSDIKAFGYQFESQ